MMRFTSEGGDGPCPWSRSENQDTSAHALTSTFIKRERLLKSGTMAYPEPILPLEGKRAKQFQERWAKFRLSKKDKEVYAGARKAYEKAKRRKAR